MLNLLLLTLWIPFSCSLYLRSRNIFGKMSLSGRCRQLRAVLLNNDIGVSKAAHMLNVGKLVAFPTETVYGLGANAFNETAVHEVFRMKGRPSSDPLIVHVANADMMHTLFDFNSYNQSMQPYRQNYAAKVCAALSTAFWPGPLTLVYKASNQVPSIVCANTGQVGVRCPKHPLALKLLEAAGVPIAAPSAVSFFFFHRYRTALYSTVQYMYTVWRSHSHYCTNISFRIDLDTSLRPVHSMCWTISAPATSQCWRTTPC